MSLESSEWRCPHGHNKDTHPVCYQNAKDKQNNQKLEKPSWVHAGKCKFTTSKKMFRVTVDELNSYFFFLQDFYDILAGHRQELTLWRVEKRES